MSTVAQIYLDDNLLRCQGLLHNGGIGWCAAWLKGAVATVIRGWVSVLWPGHFAIAMLGTPARGTSLTVIWNNRYSIWKASRFQRASGPVVLTA